MARSGPVQAPAMMREEAAVGTLVHRYLELMAKDGGPWPRERFDTLRPAMRAWLQAQGLGPHETDAAETRTMRLLQNFVSSPLAQWVLAPHQDAVSESGMRTDHPRGAAVAVLDRSFIAAGERWIIDYKTTALNSEARAATPEGEAARQALAETHREQLDRYASLFAAESAVVRRAILFLEGPCLVELR